MFFGNEMDLGGNYSFVNILKSCLRNSPWVNHVLLDVFKTQEDVEMYRQWPDYGDFRCLIYRMEMI